MAISKRFFLSFLVLLISACTKQAHTAPYINFSKVESESEPVATADPYVPPTRIPDQPIYTPTPSAPKPLPTLRTEDITYIVQWGDTIRAIAYQYNLLPQKIINVNGITNPGLILAGQKLLLPAPVIWDTGTGFKLIPDSELINSPYTVRFRTVSFINNQSGYLEDYQEEVDGEPHTGSEIVQRISEDYSINPRLLIALIEHQSQWVTTKKNKNNPYPLSYEEAGYEGLYRQLAWAADELNRGYYLWKVKGIGAWTLTDGINVPMFSLLLPYKDWLTAVSEEGFFSTYSSLFGYPFDYTYSPLVPEDLAQPQLQLPFEDGVTWLFSGGPHGGWDTGSAWAALDFAPNPGDVGCSTSNAWVVAVADGIIVRSDHGAVTQSLDGDPYGQTGWSIGHPSCEGGISTGTHLHIARRYNGEWIPADQDIPFIMDDWVSQGLGFAYQGIMTRGDQVIRAEDTKTDYNRIQR